MSSDDKGKSMSDDILPNPGRYRVKATFKNPCKDGRRRNDWRYKTEFKAGFEFTITRGKTRFSGKPACVLRAVFEHEPIFIAPREENVDSMKKLCKLADALLENSEKVIDGIAAREPWPRARP